jgi:hypothetical protein
VRAFEGGFEMGVKPIDARIVEAVLSRQINDLEAQMTRNGYDIRSLVEQFGKRSVNTPGQAAARSGSTGFQCQGSRSAIWRAG